MLVNSFTWPERVEKIVTLCDYCLKPKKHIYDTKKLRLTKNHHSDICEECIIFHMKAYRESKQRKEGIM